MSERLFSAVMKAQKSIDYLDNDLLDLTPCR